MNKFFLILFMVFALGACSKVPSGNVGVKVYLLGSSKGVDNEVLGPGRYWIGVNEELFLFPTFTQNVVWTADKTESSPTDESITFQTREGMSVNADVGVSYYIKPDMVSTVFQKYRKGVEEITDTYLRNMVRDAFVTAASTRDVETVYGMGKAQFIDEVEMNVRQQTKDIGIVVEKVYLIGTLRLPEQVLNALNSKIAATQRAQQRENELREAEAEAKKVYAKAEGEAKAILAKAQAEAEANKKLAASLSPELVQYRAIEKWSGNLPQVSSGAVPFINLK